MSPDTVDKVDFLEIHELARNLLADAGEHLSTAQDRIDAAFDRAWYRVGSRSALATVNPSQYYWRQEIDQVIKGRGLAAFVNYEHLERRGRVIPLNGEERALVWELLVAYTDELRRRGVHDHNDVLSAAVDLVSQSPPDPGWSAVLIDEIQDLPLLGLRLCTLLGGTGTDGLFFVGDGQQALYSGGFTLAEANVSVLGRATVLRVNYRNTREILASAQQLVSDHEFYDLDPTSERGTRDVEVLRGGPPPVQVSAPHRRGLTTMLLLALRRDNQRGVDYGDMAILTHTRKDGTFLRDYLTEKGIAVQDLAGWDGEPDHKVKVGTVHRAQGLDFASVYLPTLSPHHKTGSSADQAEREGRRLRHSFVGRTRARDRLWIGTVTPPTPQDVTTA
jgi:superfamily I DNA/RNA helicase